MTEPSGSTHLDFGAAANFDDLVTLQGGQGSVLVRVTFETLGTQTGSTQGHVNLRVGQMTVNLDPVPFADVRTLESQAQIGNPFDLEAQLFVRSGPVGPFCPGGAAGQADYHSGGNGVRIVQFEVLDLDGRPLSGLTATGSSGTVYLSPADVNGDGHIDVLDLVDVIVAWGPCAPPPDGCPADVDGDNEVGVNDLIAVVLAWS